MEQIPVYVISGFLGAGKTTSILRLLERKPPLENWAILVNEFGKISIDGQTLQSKSSLGSVFEVMGGCICCTSQIYFQDNLQKIIQTSQFDRILIEPSGLGGLEPISEHVRRSPELLLMPVICIVDLAMTKIPRLKNLPIYRNQIAQADRILFSKSDMISGNEFDLLKNQFSIDFPGKTYIQIADLEATLFTLPEKLKTITEFQFSGIFQSVSIEKGEFREFHLPISGGVTVNPEKLTELLKSEGSIMRAKGYIYTGNEWKRYNYTSTGNSIETTLARDRSELVIICDSIDLPDILLLKSKIESL